MEDIWESHKLLCVSVGIVLAAIVISSVKSLFED